MPHMFHPALPHPVARYVRLQQNGSGIVGIDLFTPLGSTTFYNDATQIVTAWDVYTNVG